MTRKNRDANISKNRKNWAFFHHHFLFYFANLLQSTVCSFIHSFLKLKNDLNVEISLTSIKKKRKTLLLTILIEHKFIGRFKSDLILSDYELVFLRLIH